MTCMRMSGARAGKQVGCLIKGCKVGHRGRRQRWQLGKLGVGWVSETERESDKVLYPNACNSNTLIAALTGSRAEYGLRLPRWTNRYRKALISPDTDKLFRICSLPWPFTCLQAVKSRPITSAFVSASRPCIDRLPFGTTWISSATALLAVQYQPAVLAVMIPPFLLP